MTASGKPNYTLNTVEGTAIPYSVLDPTPCTRQDILIFCNSKKCCCFFTKNSWLNFLTNNVFTIH